ncbi:GDSL-type esterase/lipase family protein [Paenarthrobacter nicotinovorans]|uniref:GDSL-type esterase/lipase family protein n=1 Tax=Paenarthrobacter nicotinovorans TaxID=29320 RepID=UPI003749A022
MTNPIRRYFYRTFERSIAMRRSQFEILPLPASRVLFLGDSITEGGQWDEWFPNLPTLNRGIGGDTVAGVGGRLDSAINEPAAISLLIGTNDLGAKGRSPRIVDELSLAIEELVISIRQMAPGSPLLLNSVMPRHQKYADAIRRLNERIRVVAAKHDAVFVDLWPVLATEEGALRSEFSSDALHLNGAGYRVWVDTLTEALSPLSLSSKNGTL